MDKQSRVWLLRKEKKLKQAQLADFVGLSQQTISRIESDRSKMTVDALSRLAIYFGVTADYILGLSNQRRGGSDWFEREHLEFEQFHDFYQAYKELSDRDKELLNRLARDMRALSEQEK